MVFALCSTAAWVCGADQRSLSLRVFVGRALFIELCSMRIDGHHRAIDRPGEFLQRHSPIRGPLPIFCSHRNQNSQPQAARPHLQENDVRGAKPEHEPAQLCRSRCVLACATRPGTPFKTLLIDDPVQSMDDEHTEAFKKQVIEKLLDAGFHIVLLTHMHRLAEDIASLYRARGAELFKMSRYSISGPSIDWKGPEITRLLEAVRKNKDGNDHYRKQATRDLRFFVERFAKDLFMAQTKSTVSKRYEDKSRGELRELLRRCKDFDTKNERNSRTRST
jgi:hypothetical protein